MILKSSTGGNIQVALLSGHTIVVPPEGRDVEKKFLQEAFKCGCVPMEVDLEEDEQVGNVETGLTGQDKIRAIVEAMKKMLNDGCKLTGAGLPNLKELAVVTGFSVNKLEAHEAWNILEKETEQP